MTKDQKLFDEAVLLINTKPQPENTIELLDAMRAKLSQESIEYFDELYEAAYVASPTG